VRATLLGVPGSHPTLAAELMLARKGVEVRRVDLVAGAHRAIVRAAGFPGVTVPALRLDGQRLQGTRTIALALDTLVPEPPLVPRDPARREAVLRAESWGDEVLQPVPRRLAWAALKRDHSTLETYLEDARLGIPAGLAARTALPFIHLSARLNRATDEAVRRDLRALPGLLERVDGLLAEGAIGQGEPTVADYQIATSVRLLMTLDDLRGLIEERPAGRHALSVAPRFPGRIGPVFPPEWLPAATR
jgi:glutathione S-transferase